MGEEKPLHLVAAFFFFVSSPVARPVEFGVHRCGINGSIVTTRQLDNL